MLRAITVLFVWILCLCCSWKNLFRFNGSRSKLHCNISHVRCEFLSSISRFVKGRLKGLAYSAANECWGNASIDDVTCNKTDHFWRHYSSVVIPALVFIRERSTSILMFPVSFLQFLKINNYWESEPWNIPLSPEHVFKTIHKLISALLTHLFKVGTNILI